MAVPMQCTMCEYRFKVPDEYAGRRGRCPQCKTMLDVPPAASGEPAVAPPRAASTAPPRRVPRSAAQAPPLGVQATDAPAGSGTGFPYIAVDDPSPGARRSPLATRTSALRRHPGVPLWLWISLASGAMVLVAVTAWLFTGGGGSGGDGDARSGTPPRLAAVNRRPALPDGAPETSVARPGDAAGKADDGPSESGFPSLGGLPTAVVASTLEEVKRAVVKVEVPVAGGMRVESGSGFFVDGRGWIATNDHVIKNINSAARVRLADGMVCEIEGVIARVPDRDLALLKLRERPYKITVLDIFRDNAARLGEQVYAFGHPYNADFSLSKGIVSRVLNTGELNPDARRMLRSTIQTPDNVVWIQHDAKISPGNSGGPLIDEQGRVLGINSFVHLQAEFGYASDVRYLREMVRGAKDQAEPLPPASNVAQRQEAGALPPNVAFEQLHELFAQAEGFHFQPDSQQQYATLANLAAVLTMAKHVAHQPGNLSAEAAAEAGRTADGLVARLEAIEFRPEQLEAVNRFAQDVEEKPGQGVFAFGTVVGQGPNALILQVEEGGKNFIVQVGPELAKADPLSRWLVLGVYSNQVVQVERGDGGESRSMRVLMMYYMLRT